MHTAWNQDYYDMLEYYFWEPQHLGKIKKDPGAAAQNFDVIVEKLRKKEVPLNHIFNLFMRLCPSVIRKEILGKITNNYNLGNVRYQSKYNAEKLYGKDVTQPDILMLDESDIVAIEMKLNKKTNIEQLVKYAMLFYFEKEISKQDKGLHLIYLTKDDFPSMFTEKLFSMDDLNSKFVENIVPDKTEKGNISFVGKKKDIVSILKRINLYFITYSEFYAYICEIKDQIDLSAKYSEAVISLLDGLISELKIRLLI